MATLNIKKYVTALYHSEKISCNDNHASIQGCKNWRIRKKTGMKEGVISKINFGNAIYMSRVTFWRKKIFQEILSMTSEYLAKGIWTLNANMHLKV